MTNLDPKHLDALVERVMKISMDLGCPSTTTMDSALVRELCATITALRALIDRERAATIEAAAKVVDGAGMSLKPAAGWAEHDVAWWETGGLDHILAATDAIRALHTDATRAAMDAIRREGYEAGARDSAKLCVSLRKEADRPEAEAVGCMDCASALLALAASIPPNPDTNADSRQQAAPADGEKLQLSERYQAIYEQACARDALDERQGLHLRMGGVVEVCPICDIAGCHHIRDRAAASRQPFAPNATEAECPQPEKWRAGECCGGCLGSSKRPPLSAQVPRLNDDTIPRK